jgi:hypothetical protein
MTSSSKPWTSAEESALTNLRAIWPFTLFPGAFDLHMPKGAHLLDIQLVEQTPVLWAIVDVNAPMETRSFSVLATLDHFDAAGLVYVGTFVGRDGAGHLFEKRESERVDDAHVKLVRALADVYTVDTDQVRLIGLVQRAKELVQTGAQQ